MILEDYGILDMGFSDLVEVDCNCDINGEIFAIKDAENTKQP